MWNRIKNACSELNQPIYTGERLRNNLRALTAISIFCAVMGLIMIVMNVVQHNGLVVLSSCAFVVGGTISAIGAGVLHKRRISGITASLVCAVVFTYYAVSGAANGFAIFWVMPMPMGIAYFIGVKYGILMCAYYELLVIVLFYSPLREKMAQYYSVTVMDRYPIVFFCVAMFALISMVQYHRMMLRDIAYADRLNAEVARQTRMARERADQLETMSEETVQTLALSIDAKDRYTNGHSTRVALYAAALAARIGLPEEECLALRREALLHDVGKIGIPDAVLNKPGRLTEPEFDTIKDHASIGGRILERSESLLGAADVARHHHERWDGGGYPSGLAGEAIPLHARIVAVADAYDAMRSDRIYRQGLSSEVIRSELLRGSGSQFDPVLADAMLALEYDGTLDAVTAQADRQAAEDSFLYAM